MSAVAALLRLAWEGRKFAILLIVGGVAALFYVLWTQAQADRDGLIRWGDQTCEAAGAAFRPHEAPKRAWGAACLIEVRRLAKVEKDLHTATAADLIAALDERMGKEAADAALAAAMSKRTAETLARMEAADAAVQNDNKVGAGWACAVNDLGGLRAPDC